MPKNVLLSANLLSDSSPSRWNFYSQKKRRLYCKLRKDCLKRQQRNWQNLERERDSWESKPDSSQLLLLLLLLLLLPSLFSGLCLCFESEGRARFFKGVRSSARKSVCPSGKGDLGGRRRERESMDCKTAAETGHGTSAASLDLHRPACRP